MNRARLVNMKRRIAMRWRLRVLSVLRWVCKLVAGNVFDPSDYWSWAGREYELDGDIYRLHGVLQADDDHYWELYRVDGMGRPINALPTYITCVCIPETAGYRLTKLGRYEGLE